MDRKIFKGEENKKEPVRKEPVRKNNPHPQKNILQKQDASSRGREKKTRLGSGTFHPAEPQRINASVRKQKAEMRRRRRRRNLITAIVALFLVIMGVVSLGFALDLSSGSGTFYEGVYVDGISLHGYTMQDAITLIEGVHRQEINNKRVTLRYEDNVWELTPEMLLVKSDIDEQVRKAWDMGRTGNIFARRKTIRSLKKNSYQGKVTVSYDKEQLFARLTEIKNEIDLPAKDAKVTFDPSVEERFLFENESDGREVNLEALKQKTVQLLDSGVADTVLIESNPILPKVTHAMLKESTTRRSRATTELSNTSTADRNFNIRKAMEFFNGMVVNPGAVVSFNEVVGPRELKNGWKNAGQYVDDEVVDGPGGGICQVSTTLYQAVVKAGLEILERYKHSMPVSYIALKGTDAAVSYGDKDFVFRNNTEYPIYISGSVSSSTVSVTIYGHSLEKEGIGSISMTSEVVETYPAPEPEIIKDKEGKYVTYTDETYDLKRSKGGYKVKTFRVFKDLNGDIVEDRTQRLSLDTYKVVKGVRYVGVKQRETTPTP